MLAQSVSTLFSVYAFLLGLLIGSFLNVLIYRLPKNQSIVLPRSFCPNCGYTIRWYDNIPLLSFLWLKGRCRSCQKKISPIYPLVEIITGLLSLILFLKFGLSLSYLFYFLFLTAPLVAITFIDLEHRIIPDVLSLSGIGTGIIVHLFLSNIPLIEALAQSLVGILAGGGTLFFVSWAYEKLRKQEGIGGGDIKLAAMLGAYFGWQAVFFILLLSSLLGSIVGIILIVFFRKGLKVAIPFGPFLAGGALIFLFFGPQILHWYLQNMIRLY